MISISIVSATILINAKPSTEPILNGYLNPILIDINVIIEKFNTPLHLQMDLQVMSFKIRN